MSIAGFGGDLWQVKQGNWEIPEGLLNYKNSSPHLNEQTLSVTCPEGTYEMELLHMPDNAVVIATSLDELNRCCPSTVEIL